MAEPAAGMLEAIELRRLRPEDLPAYKRLRDAALADDPTAFTSDAETERGKAADSYLPRLGIAVAQGGVFTLGAWRGVAGVGEPELIGAISCERDRRIKVRHIGHIVGMMVRRDARGQGVGRQLVAACIAEARRADGLEMLTLTVTASNASAVRLYEGAGFVRYGSLPHAIKVDGHYHAKDHMVLSL
ncbi:MAG TPA: N-acetyltransferase [Burkholderiaceae bacterium]|nr:N-acetyltransferase [Burkholderiaceae bacterium]